MAGHLKGALRSLALDLQLKKIVDLETGRKIEEYTEKLLEEAEKKAKDYSRQY